MTRVTITVRLDNGNNVEVEQGDYISTLAGPSNVNIQAMIQRTADQAKLAFPLPSVTVVTDG